MRQLFGHLLIAMLIGIVIFVIVRFVWQRDEFGYIGPDKNSEWYRALMSWLDSWWNYLSWDITSLSQTQQYFKRAVDQNRDTVLGNTLAINLNKVEERSQLETIQQCVSAVRNIGATWDEIDVSYNQLLQLLQDQINLMPTVLISIKNINTIKCVKNYFDHIKNTSILLVETSQSRWKQKQEYAGEINNYPKQLGNCDKIILIQEQSRTMKQKLADMIYQYNQYRDTLNDPARHSQLCSQQYSSSISWAIISLKAPRLQQLWDDINGAIDRIKTKMNQ